MDAQQALLDKLKIRLGYNQDVTLTRDEFSLLIDGDIGIQKELESDIDHLEGLLDQEREDSRDLEEEVVELKKEIEDLEEKIKELEGEK